jgi:hypothetical protein
MCSKGQDEDDQNMARGIIHQPRKFSKVCKTECSSEASDEYEYPETAATSDL